jgi:SOS-response transcriptional repressor LexA
VNKQSVWRGDNQVVSTTIHPSYQRLTEAAGIAVSSLGGAQEADGLRLQRDLRVSSAVLSNWKTRGVSKSGAIQAGRLYGCSPDWILDATGTPPAAGASSADWKNPQNLFAGEKVSSYASGGAKAQILSQRSSFDAPLVSWEQLMKAKMPRLFRVKLIDDSLAPDLDVGDELTIDTELVAAAGDLVLVADDLGNHYARIYKARRAGQWLAVATNEAFAPLDAELDRLSIVGVCVRETRHRRRSKA